MGRLFTFLCASLVLLAIFSVCASASAQAARPGGGASEAGSPPDADEQKRTEAKERFLRGLDLASQDNWDAALVEFMASRELYPTRAALGNIPLSLRRLKRYAEAIDAYNELIQKFGSALSTEERKKVDEALGELRSFVGEIDVEVDQRGAVVVVDGQQRGTTPLPAAIVVNAGTHSLRISCEGFEIYEAQVPVAGKQRKTIQAKLRRMARSGGLIVKEAEGKVLDVLVDGAVVGKTPWQGTLAIGVHGVALRGEGNVGSLPGAATDNENETATVTLAATLLDAKVRIEPVPASARVDIDGVGVGAGIWEGQLTSGEHVIEVYAPGHIAYSKRINVTSSRREIVRVALERDLNDAMWTRAFRPHLFVEAMGGLAYSPSFGTSAEAACGRSVALPSTGSVDGCSDQAAPFGFLAGARGGYQMTAGIALEVFLGYLQMSNSQKRAIVAEGELNRAYESADATDKTTVSAPLAALSASYRFLEKTPLTFRIWAGAARARVKHELAGTFSGSVPYVNDAGVMSSATLNERVTVFEPSTNVWVPLVGPEVRLGYRFSQRFMIDLGVAGLLFFGPGEARKGPESSIGASEDRPTVLQNIPVADSVDEVRSGILSPPREKSIATYFGVMPTLAMRVDF